MMEGHRRWLVVMAGLVALVAVHHLCSTYHHPCSDLLWTLEDQEFEDFDNETGINTGEYIVPNIVHFLRMGPNMKHFNLLDTVCVLAALKHQKPDKLYFHTDHANFTGEYWEKLLSIKSYSEIIQFIPTKLPSEIFGQQLSKSYHLYHAGDILRIRLLIQYGGIFLDNDSYLVRSLDTYRKYEMVLSWDEGSSLGNQVLVAHKDARFLKLWLESYRDNYYPGLWYYNAGVRPTKTVLWARPELVHRVRLLFGTQWLVREIYYSYWPEWRQQYAVHLLARHYNREKVLVDGRDVVLPNPFTESNILNYSITLRDMVQDVFPY